MLNCSVEFGNIIYKEHEGKNTYVYSYDNVEYNSFLKHAQVLVESGLSVFNEYNISDNHFMLLTKENDLVMLSYYPNVKQMRIVTEPNSAYLTFSDELFPENVQPLLTQINLEDHGMSYVLRLSDGRFIIFDGGWEFDVDADKLMDTMKVQSPYGKPVVAAWIMTHPHIDHYRCYLAFEEKYAQEVVIQRFIYNFPDTDDESLKRIPALKNEIECMNRLEHFVKLRNVPVYRAHTGQIFEIGGSKLEILSSPDDTYFVPVKDLNPLSLVIRMEIEGQVILWCADTYLEVAELANRWGKYLKSDILQVPHHGFCGGDETAYDLVNPHTCIVPVEEICQEKINIYNRCNRHLMYNLNVQDFYVSTIGNLTLKLPYSPRANGRKILFDSIDRYEKSYGARSWFFDDMTDKDCDFKIINSLGVDAVILVDLLFEDKKHNVKSIKIDVEASSIVYRNLLNSCDVDHDAFYFNRSSFKNLGLPENEKFTIHFRSNIPVIIVGGKEPVYIN